MVKSFQGVRVVETKKNEAALTVGACMSTKLITFRPEDPVLKVVEVFAQKKISGAPVVDDAGKLIGMISEGDCLQEVIRGKYSNTPQYPSTVENYMTREVRTLQQDMSLFEAAQAFRVEKVRRFPVLSASGQLVGQISISDVIRVFARLQATTW
ncbi:hypothetical protein A3SI_12194 [Nitritalea halalkaliphila LW7]|uniref:CBS domain-containing protein n=1 Tax=Nitritalea halalkaliphila LW7 TaxID=1189621 RepID=I5C1V4_9BACT|nr:CBS domain-containing protein [Nitritalea halalkaliphila]EIM75806.1 hypothetical protein A3SI_12194 [Nitritalea halalkaliphila LW7]